MKTKRYFSLLLVLLMLQPLIAVTKNEAKNLVQKGQYQQAVEALQTLMRQPANARDAECQKLLGQSYCMLGQYAEALPYLEQAVKQNRKSGALWYLTITRQHLYDFDGAIEALETYTSVLNSDAWLERADSLMAECQIGQRAMAHTEDVVIIDSMLVARDQFFTHYRLGAESGRICMGDEGLYFENQEADHQLYCMDGGIAERHRFQNEWDDLHHLSGIGSQTFSILDPFLRTDGETLYFACDSTPGMGGLDIYRTTFDPEDGSFYQAERLGMPFNSPFDDYMMAIDETYKVGWWATERRAVADSVMIYLFMLDEDPTYLDEPSVSRARIDCIAETWRDEAGYAGLVNELMNAPQEVVVQATLHIIITDGVVYGSEDQFRSAKARSEYRQACKVEQQIHDLESTLAAQRQRYAAAEAKARASLAQQIAGAEDRLLDLYQQHRSLVMDYRRHEVEQK